MERGPIEVATDHRCMLADLTAQVAREGTGPSRVAGALRSMLERGDFQRCCLPHYIDVAPDRFARELQIPIARRGELETRVLVWPAGAGDATHPHVDGWTVFIPVTGELAQVAERPGESPELDRLATGRPLTLRPEERVRHRLRNVGAGPAVTIHVSGRS
jgi:hypothetical protein